MNKMCFPVCFSFPILSFNSITSVLCPFNPLRPFFSPLAKRTLRKGYYQTKDCGLCISQSRVSISACELYKAIKWQLLMCLHLLHPCRVQ